MIFYYLLNKAPISLKLVEYSYLWFLSQKYLEKIFGFGYNIYLFCDFEFIS